MAVFVKIRFFSAKKANFLIKKLDFLSKGSVHA